MKAYTVVIGIVLIAGATGSAQAQSAVRKDDCRAYLSTTSSYKQAYVDRAVKNYRGCLESPNAGVVESALAHVAKMKLILQVLDCKGLEKRIDFLTMHGQTPAIRYKAYLTRMVFDNPGMFLQDSQTEYKDSDELFGAVANRIQQTLLGYN